MESSKPTKYSKCSIFIQPPKTWIYSLKSLSNKTKIGDGQFGKIYKAKYTDPNTSKETDVVIKKLKNSEQDARCGFFVPLFRELSFSFEFNHPNIISVYDVITSKPSASNFELGSFYIVMECWRHDIKKYVDNRTKLSLRQVKFIAKEVLKAISYLHSRGFCHRDIKLENVLINDSKQIKVTDFGLSKKINASNLNMTLSVGTLHYKAPELLIQSSDYSFPVDMWAFGVLLYELVFGHPPFEANNNMQQFVSIIKYCGWDGLQKYKQFEEIQKNWWRPSTINKLEQLIAEEKSTFDSSCLVNILKMLLEVDPDKRIKADEALRHRFFAFESKDINLDDLPLFETRSIESDLDDHQDICTKSTNVTNKMLDLVPLKKRNKKAIDKLKYDKNLDSVKKYSSDNCIWETNKKLIPHKQNQKQRRKYKNAKLSKTQMKNQRSILEYITFI